MKNGGRGENWGKEIRSAFFGHEMPEKGFRGAEGAALKKIETENSIKSYFFKLGVKIRRKGVRVPFTSSFLSVKTPIF